MVPFNFMYSIQLFLYLSVQKSPLILWVNWRPTSLKPFLITSAPWDYFFLYPVNDCTVFSGPHELPGCATDLPFPAVPFVPVSSFRSCLSLPGKPLLCQALSALWARYPPVCLITPHTYIYFSTAALGPHETFYILLLTSLYISWNSFCILFIPVPRTMPGIDQMFSICLRRWAAMKPCSVT